jgi:pimeloyl-ACP methyl ester carboxylesterase
LGTRSFRYVFMNYRGYGERIDVTGDYTVEEIARDALTLADELGVDKFSVVGHSMGGSAAQRVLSLAPDRVTKMVGISPVPASGVPFDDDSPRADARAVHRAPAEDPLDRAGRRARVAAVELPARGQATLDRLAGLRIDGSSSDSRLPVDPISTPFDLRHPAAG